MHKERINTVKVLRVLSGRLVALFSITLAFSALPAMAQSTIFNIPSTDVVDKGKGYVEFDFLPQAPAPDTTRTYIYNPRLVVGVAKGLEVGVNFPVTHTSPVNAGYVQPNFKYKFFANDDKGVAMSGGLFCNTPINHRDGQDSYGYVYANLSK